MANISKTTRRGVIGLVILVAVIIVIVSHHSGPATTYTAKIDSIAVIDPGEVSVFVDVTNTGNSSGAPACTINVSSPAGAYSGFDVFDLKPLAAGSTTTFNGNITVTNQGASYADVGDSTVKCS